MRPDAFEIIFIYADLLLNTIVYLNAALLCLGLMAVLAIVNTAKGGKP